MTKENNKSQSVAIFFCFCRLPLLDLFKAFRNAFQWQKQDLSKGFDIAFSDILLCTISYTQTTYLHTIRFTASPRAFSKSHQRNFRKKEFQTIEENMKILLGNKKLVFSFAFLFYLAAYIQKKKKKTIVCSSVPFKKKSKEIFKKKV